MINSTQKRDLKKIFLNSAHAGLSLQLHDGSFPSGNNGPWNHIDTPVRNTAHWAFLMYAAFLIKGNEKFRISALNACNYLIQPNLRPSELVFTCRTAPAELLKSNGLIGQTWAVEPLILVGHHEKSEKYLKVVEQVLNSHSFNDKKGLFESVEVAGRRKEINYTLNQQIWFASVIFRYTKVTGNTENQLFKNAVKLFSNIDKISDIYDDGCYKHSIRSSRQRKILHRIAKNKGELIAFITRKGNGKDNKVLFNQREVSVGYHSFILTGLALAYIQFPELTIWKRILKSKKFNKALEFSLEMGMKENDNRSAFSYQYNPTGIENAFSWKIFKSNFMDLEKDIPLLIELSLKNQFTKHLNEQSGFMDHNSTDSATLRARLYELFYLLDN